MVSSSFFCSAFIWSGWRMAKRSCAAAAPTDASNASVAIVSLMAFSRCLRGWPALDRECRPGALPAQPPCPSLLAVHLCVNAVLDLVEQRAALRLPAKRARAFAAHAAVRAEAQIRARSEPIDRLADRPVLRLVAETEHAAERLRHRLEIRLAVLGVEQRAGLRLFERQQIEIGDVRDVHMPPDVQAPPDMTRRAVLARDIDQLRQLHAGG